LLSSRNLDELYDLFERHTTIYISRNTKPVIFKNNVLEENIGLFGGAISINSPNWSETNTMYHQSTVKGAVYVEGAGADSCVVDTVNGIEECGEEQLIMTGTNFDGNEAGYEYRYERNHDPASALYIKNVRYAELTSVNFKNHKKTNFIDLVPFNRGITYGLPSNYLESSHAPVIRIK
jgi:hypothetical protein